MLPVLCFFFYVDTGTKFFLADPVTALMSIKNATVSEIQARTCTPSAELYRILHYHGACAEPQLNDKKASQVQACL